MHLIQQVEGNSVELQKRKGLKGGLEGFTNKERNVLGKVPFLRGKVRRSPLSVDQEIPVGRLKVTCLREDGWGGGFEPTVRLGIKSWFTDQDINMTSFWACASLFNNTNLIKQDSENFIFFYYHLEYFLSKEAELSMRT